MGKPLSVYRRSLLVDVLNKLPQERYTRRRTSYKTLKTVSCTSGIGAVNFIPVSSMSHQDVQQTQSQLEAMNLAAAPVPAGDVR